MSFNFSPKIVTNGLVVYYDAANPNSYISGSTTWSDMYNKPVNDLTLFSGATFSPSNSGSIVYNGDVLSRVGKNTNINTGDNFTVSVWMNAALLGTTRRAIVSNSYNYAGRNGWMLCTAGGSINNTFFSIGADAAGVQGKANLLTINTWYYLTVTVLSGGATSLLYINDTLSTNTIPIGSGGIMTYTNNQFNIGSRDVNGQTDPFTGNISLVQIYNRVLLPTEIAQNYNTTKSRFGKL